MKIKDIRAEDRPREKMLLRGVGALTDTELVAVLLRTGNRDESAIELAAHLLENSQNKLTSLCRASFASLMQTRGIGKEKAATLAAAFEIGRRFFAESSPGVGTRVHSSGMVYDGMRPILKGLDHEECWVLFLNNANAVTHRQRMSSGGLDATVLDVRTITRMALEHRATGIALVHNHPSGDPHPGTADVRETERLKLALEPLGIALIDHVVFADDSFFSFADGECHHR